MSLFRDVLLFLDKVGVYDVLLPFILIFAIVFAILEKTRLFGEEEFEGKKYTRKNINAMVAFVMAFFVVASAQLVATISDLMANVAMVIVAFVMFMLMIGVFHEDKSLSLSGGWSKTFMIISFIAIILIFFNSLGWLMPAYYFLINGISGPVVSMILFLIILLAIIYFIVKEPSKKENKK